MVTYANYPTTEYLSPDLLDFVTFNLFIDRPEDLDRYLARLMNQAGDRPLVLGEIGRHTESHLDDAGTAEWLSTQLDAATQAGVAGTCVFSWTDDWNVAGTRVEGWRFGLTHSNRTPRPALEAVRRASVRTIRDLRRTWPTMSVVICARSGPQISPQN